MEKSRVALGIENRTDVIASLETRVEIAQILATSVN